MIELRFRSICQKFGTRLCNALVILGLEFADERLAAILNRPLK